MLKLFLITGSFESNYNGVFARHPYAVPVKETEEGGFPAALSHCLDLILDVVGNSGTICFCVDDLIFIDNIDLR